MKTILILFAVLWLTAAARAATFTVTSTADPGNGACTPATTGDGCTLHEAIAVANSAAGADTIVFAAGVTGTIQLSGALPDLFTSITLTGPGANLLTVFGENAHNIFIVRGSTVGISGLTIANGFGLALEAGGGLHNDNGTVTVSNCVFSNNQGRFGGAILNLAESGGTATLTAQNCAVIGNTAGQEGGGILNEGIGISTAALTVQNCTFVGNSAFETGGGISNRSGSTATVKVSNSTFSHNAAPAGGGIATISGNTSATVTTEVGNTILQTGASGANLSNGNTNGVIISRGYNLSDDNGSGFLTGTGDQTFTDARLDSAGLQNNGGPTPTIALLSDSPARDKGKNLGGAGTDQRGTGFSRTVNFSSIANASGGDGSDIGAFEVQDAPQSGPTFVVNTRPDGNDGACTEAHCTLREAINAANAEMGPTTIFFTANLVGAIFLTQGHLSVTDSVTINGPGARALAVNGNGASRVFSFIGGSSVMNNLSISGGKVAGGPGDGASGGGIFNQAELIVRDCALGGHQAQGGAGASGGKGGTSLGGAAFNTGKLTFNRCSFNGNSATGGKGGDDPHGVGGNGGAGVGGAIYNAEGATLNLNNCTFSNNAATGGAGGNAPLGGPNGSASFGGDGGNGLGTIFNQGTMTLTNSTLSNNSGTGGAGGQGSASTVGGAPGLGTGGLTSSGSADGTSTVRSTISAGNTANNAGGRDVQGAFTSQGFNLIGSSEHSSGFTAATDQSGTDAMPLDPKLGPHTNNGGSTNTMALLSGSPAIDQGNSFGVLVDQRLRTRPTDNASIANAPGGDGSDIGAFEFGSSLAALPKISIDDVTINEGNAGSRNAYFTVSLSEPPSSTVTVDYATANGATKPASAGSDYHATSGTLTFTAGQVAQILNVPVLGDSLDEDDETFFFNLSNAAQAIIGDAQGVGTITDDDAAPTLAVGDQRALNEGSAASPGSTTFAVRLAAPSGKTITVKYATQDGTAKADSDYVAKSGTLTFAPGTTVRSVKVDFIGDSIAELNETLFLGINTPTNATIADSRGSAYIKNDDGPQVTIANAPAVFEGNPPSNGAPGLTNQVFTVTLSASSTNTVTVDYATANNTAGPADFVAQSGTLSFTPGVTSKTITVQVKGDTTPEPTETYRVRLNNPKLAVIADSTGVAYIKNDDGTASTN